MSGEQVAARGQPQLLGTAVSTFTLPALGSLPAAVGNCSAVWILEKDLGSCEQELSGRSSPTWWQ